MDETTQRPDDGMSSATIAKLVAIGILVLLFVVFAIQNAASVTVEFLAWEFQMRRIILMVLSAAIGIAIWELAGLTWRRRRERRAGESG